MANTASAQQDVRIYPIDAKKSGLLVKSFTERSTPTIVFVYASWCSVCQRNFPSLIDLAQKYKDKGLNVLALSLDKDESALKRYLASHDSLPFTPYHVKENYSGEFISSMQQVGVKYRNAIPYTILYDNKGTLVGQGNILVSSLAPVIELLTNPAKQ